MKGFGYNILRDMANRPNARSACSAIKLEVTGVHQQSPKGMKRRKATHPRLASTYRGARRNLRRVMRIAELTAKRPAPHHHENVI
jgi:hypothetical protein